MRRAAAIFFLVFLSVPAIPTAPHALSDTRAEARMPASCKRSAERLPWSLIAENRTGNTESTVNGTASPYEDEEETACFAGAIAGEERIQFNGDRQYLRLRELVPELAHADAVLNKIWKEVIARSDSRAREALRKQQREWVRLERATAASRYKREGKSLACAYVASVWDRISYLRRKLDALQRDELSDSSEQDDPTLWQDLKEIDQ